MAKEVVGEVAGRVVEGGGGLKGWLKGCFE